MALLLPTSLMALLLPTSLWILLDVVAWALVHAAVGYLVHRLPATRFSRDNLLTRSRPFEDGGRLYQRLTRVKRWKAWLPEAGNFFRGGFDKRQLSGTDDRSLERYMRETRRAETGHWITLVVAPLFFAWNPPRAGAVMVLYALVINVPCILALRYNRLRLERILGIRRNIRKA